MNNFKILNSSNRARALLAAAALAATAAVAGCGSGGSSTITVGNENTADNSLITASETTKSSKSSTTAAKTPTSGPLSKEPKVTVPSGPAPSKLETKDLIVGTGAEAKDGDSVTVNYVGVLYKNGKEFNASWETKEPFTFTLGKGQVIKGWDQGVVGMKVGGRRELVIPAALAYGAKGSPPKIPANEALVFVVDLLGT
ncbi:MAG TPA: FKBP-type peptidyl-prolyl cis-trans isomerase [Solirubrobacteraceae bacterium]|nr:FKBP-type peptidyl-prolyl cis-trans isomerase [Solirubrobacteraceae bacterium]